MATVQATIHGQTYTLTYNSSTGKYEATLTAPSDSSYPQTGHYFPVTVRVSDEAGNTVTADDNHATLGSSLRLYARENIKPIISSISPSSGAAITTSNPQIKFKVLDSTLQSSGYSGVDPSSIELTVNGNTVANSAITKTAVAGGYECTYTPEAALPDGLTSVNVAASDFDGNAAEAVGWSFKIDTIAPTHSLTAPAEGLVTNQPEIHVIGDTSDATSSPVTVTITVNDVDQGAVTVNESGHYDKKVTLSNGVNIIKSTSTDSSGKATTITRTVTLKTDAPVIKSVSIVPNHVECGKTYKIEVEIDE